MRPHRRAILIVIIAAVAVWAWGQWESPTRRAYRVCGECADLATFDVDSLIDIMRDNRLNRGQCLELYRQHSVGPAAECELCAVAVLDAALQTVHLDPMVSTNTILFMSEFLRTALT